MAPFRPRKPPTALVWGHTQESTWNAISAEPHNWASSAISTCSITNCPSVALYRYWDALLNRVTSSVNSASDASQSSEATRCQPIRAFSGDTVSVCVALGLVTVKSVTDPLLFTTRLVWYTCITQPAPAP